jgi:hypothetical protein
MTDCLPPPARPPLARRDFLRLGVVAGPASLVAACGWDGGALLRPRLQTVSRLNDWLGERLQSSGRLAPEYDVAERSRMMPSYFISRTVPTLPDSDA